MVVGKSILNSKYFFFLIVGSMFLVVAKAQEKTIGSKVFWKENFAAGKLPDGWKNVDVAKKGDEWIVTNQPYPGSYQYQQQAPPIASKSRGYHLQYQAGYIVDEDQPAWEKKKEYPDAYIQTAPINCSGHESVILRLQQTFRYNNYKKADSAGLYIGISTDSVHWHDVNAMHNAPSATDMFKPMQEELDITQWAANHPKVYVRFYWRGYFSWYWMVDDIELADAYKNDIGIVRLMSQNEGSNIFKTSDTLALRIKNNGSKDIGADFDITCQLDNKKPLKIRVPASKSAFIAGTEMEVDFTNIDLAKLPSHNLLFLIDYPTDENPANDSLRIKVNASETSLGNVDSINSNANGTIISSGVSKVKVIFYNDAIFRIWLAPDGNFTDPAGTDIAIGYPTNKPVIKTTNEGSYYKLQSKLCVVRIYKAPLRFAMYDVTNTKAVWEEDKPILFGIKTSQSMLRHADEYFYGCGMQNGYFSHRDNDVLIEKGGGWNDGGRANPVPFYMSTAGYGVLRNTFDVGRYSFKDSLRFSHNENRFDAIYFYGPSLKEILGNYTSITGKPFLMPRWALSMGDANCYNKLDRNKQPQTIPAVIKTVADKYIENDMPRGWILPNDGYGCGYVKLDSVVSELAKRGFRTGLWTENGVSKIATEVGQYGTRLCKLDVAWVGPGYKYALDACKAAYKGIEDNSNARGFVWSVMGWAGTQHYSTVWSGDQSGSWEYIRFHIPTLIGSGLSGFNAATGDVDGIFRGSDSTYVRDLQWKCFTPVFMVMSGWAKKDKQPYVQGEPFISINRKYLQLKMRLTPYMYTLMNEAYQTGVPAVRGLVLEYPQDPIAYGKATQYEYLLGKSFLVAPVYKSEGKRDSIYLPKGKWIDYWDGKTYTGNQWLNNYPAPLEKLPLFVKSGSIIPMYPKMDFDGQKPLDTLSLDIYPNGTTQYQLYEDDGLTREHRKGVFATTNITVVQKTTLATIVLDAIKGNYNGMLQKRSYVLYVHVPNKPIHITVNGKVIKDWKFNALDRRGTIYINCGKQAVSKKIEVIIM